MKVCDHEANYHFHCPPVHPLRFPHHLILKNQNSNLKQSFCLTTSPPILRHRHSYLYNRLPSHSDCAAKISSSSSPEAPLVSLTGDGWFKKELEENPNFVPNNRLLKTLELDQHFPDLLDLRS